VTDHLKSGSKALDEHSTFLSNHPDTLETRSLAGDVRPDTGAPMLLLASNDKEYWSFFGKGERYFLETRWSSAGMDLRFVVELLPEEVASYKSSGENFVPELATKIQTMSSHSPEFKRNMRYYVAERTPEQMEANERLMEAMATATFELPEGVVK
jgi:hypothetical protein